MEQLQEAISDQDVIEGLEEMEEMFDERFDFDPHPATRKAWTNLLQNGIVRVSRDDEPQGYRIIAELDFLIGMVGGETFASPYITTYVLVEDVEHMDLPDHYIESDGDSLEAARAHTDVVETIQDEAFWVNP